METVNQKINFNFVLDSFNDAYIPLIANEARYLLLYGGAGSGKSVFAAQKILMRCLREQNHKFLFIRKVARTIRGSQFSLFKGLTDDAGLNEFFSIRESDMKITCKLNGNEIVTAGVDDREKLKSIYGITSVWIEEATEIDAQDFRQIDLRLRGKTQNYKQIILSFNPVDANHWLNTTALKNSIKLRTTFRDNKFIDEEYYEVLESLKEQNPDYYKIYALGEWGVRRTLIYKPFEIIAEYPGSFEEIIYGLDFGYNNKTALVKIGIKDNQFYLSKLIYESMLTSKDLTEKIFEKGYRKGESVYCDSAEPGKIEKLKRAGINSYPADKSVKDGIDYVRTCVIFSNERNSGINKEVLSYSYKQDNDGNILEDPVKFNDHAMDAIRYALYTHKKKKKTAKIVWI